MKYKELALKKIDSLSNQMKNLEFALNHNNIAEARKYMNVINQRVEDLRSQI